MASIATIRGTAIRPGVSRNGRLYTRELIAAAVAEARERLTAGPPLTMLTHHGASDDSTRIVGRLTEFTQRPDGSAAFVAELADTQHGRDLAALVAGSTPFLDGVSIRGWWNGPVRTVQHEGQQVETGDSLTIDGLDFTKTPGVPGARVESVGELAHESADGRVLVYESVAEATARTVQRPHGDVAYADNGYLPDRVHRYPLTSRGLAAEAWQQFSDPDVTSRYTPKQLKRARGRIRAAMEEFEQMAQHSTRFGDVTEFYPAEAGAAGGVCIDAWNGPTNLTLRVAGIDPAELRPIAAAAMDAVVAALARLDPDMDADLDVPGAPNADTDGSMEGSSGRPDDDQMETAPEVPTLTETTPRRLAGDPTTTTEVPAVSEQPNPAAETANTPTPSAPQIVLTQEQFTALLNRVGSTPAAQATESAPAAAPVAETEEERISRLVTAGVSTAMESLKADLRTEMQAAGPRRVGLAIQTKTDESDMPTDRPFHELPVEQRDQLERDGLLRAFGFAK